MSESMEEARAKLRESFPELDDLEDQASQLPEAWNPENVPGAHISGTVSVNSYANSDFGEYPYLEIVDKEGKVWAIHAFHTTLSNQIRRMGPQPGERVAIHYFGTKESGGGKDPMHLYRLVVGR